MTLIEKTKGKRFRGYTSLIWSSNEEWEIEQEAFLFSLDNDKKYNVIQNSQHNKVYSIVNHLAFGLKMVEI